MKKSLQFVGISLTLSLQAIALSMPALAQSGIATLEDPTYWQELCHAQVQANLLDEAQMTCEQAIALNPDSEIAWSDYSALLLTLEQYPKALSAAGQLLSQNDQNSQAMTYQCLSYQGLDQFERALDACNNALLTNSFWGEMSPVLPLQSRGQILNQIGRYDQALIAYSQALQLEPNSFLTLAYRCQTLVDLKQYDNAKAACNQSAKDNDRFRPEAPAIAFSALGEIYTQQGNQALIRWVENSYNPEHYETAIEQYKTAIEQYDQAIARAPKNANYHLQHGWLFEQTGVPAAAMLAYTQYLTLAPESSQGLVAQCTLYNQQSQYDLAKAACEQAIAGNGDWSRVGPAEAWRGLAQAIASLGDYEAALPIIDRAIALQADFLAAESDRVVILWYLEQYNQAIQAAEQIVKEEVTAQNRKIIANTFATLGRLHSQRGNTQSAVKAYEDSLTLDNQSAEVYVNLSAALLKGEQYQKALEKAKEAMRLSPYLLEAWENMAVAQGKLGRTFAVQSTRERIQEIEQLQEIE